MKKQKVAIVITGCDKLVGAAKTESGLSTPAPLRKGELQIIAKKTSAGLIIFSMYNAILI
ncbi:hypothetical protein [Serratia proteamaculans]|jgi:hypothetical protein|uniref:hypothetical protein n=1 Tax=Serratia proteamaculans TaxID=28151 RepID=UPI0021BD865C|nr:hypothetical protein [Serratia proteamaculans]